MTCLDIYVHTHQVHAFAGFRSPGLHPCVRKGMHECEHRLKRLHKCLCLWGCMHFGKRAHQFEVDNVLFCGALLVCLLLLSFSNLSLLVSGMLCGRLLIATAFLVLFSS